MKNKMALTAAVTPIISLLVPTATFIGTFMYRFIADTFNTPPPTPNRPDEIPASAATPIPAGAPVTTYFTSFAAATS